MTAPPPLAVSIRPLTEVPDIAALWRGLEARSDASFFLGWDWIGCWLRETGASPYMLAVHHGDTLVGLALLQPARHRRHHLLNTDALMLHQVGDPDIDIITIEHNGFLVDRGFADTVPAACIEFLTSRRGNQRWNWDELHFGGVPVPQGFQQLGADAGLMAWYHSYKQSWVIDLDRIRASGRSYLDDLSANTRYQIRRAIRLYEKRGKLTARPAETVEEAMRFFDEMKELHQRYWVGRGHPGSFAYPFFEQFHRALIADCLPKGTIELIRVAAGESTIGYVYNFVSNGWVCAYHTGFVYEDDAKYKPGLVSHHLCIDRHLKTDARLYDFLAGGERYKANLAQPGPDIAYLVLQRPLLKLRAESAARWLKNEFTPGAAPADTALADAAPARSAPARSGAAGAAARRPKVLVMGDDTRSFLAIVRSLGRQGIEVHVAPENFASPALRSRYIAATHYLPFWMAGSEAWLAAMEALLRAERFDLVIPCYETTLLPIQRHRARLQRLSRFAMPDDAAMTALFDKHHTRELARSLGIPVAAGRLPRPDDTAEAVFAELGSPVVVKPRRSYSVEELQSRGKVQVVDTPEELRALLPHLPPDGILYEAFLPGRGIGVSVLASAGRVLQAFEHHRVRESGSGSYYRISAALSPPLEQACAAIVAALGYTGVAMFEFRRDDATGAWILLEVNARPWGSMPLPVGLGVDFPYRWYRLLVDQAETPAVPYRIGMFGRNLLPDLRQTLSEAKALRASPGGLLGLAAHRFAELGRPLLGRESHDVLVRDDPAPGLRELGEIAADIGGRVAHALPGTLRLAQSRGRRRLRHALRAGGPVRILFVCQGNICRSPFAEALLRAQLRPFGRAVDIASRGMLPRPGRPTPPAGIAAAAARGIDLAAHRSAHLLPAEAAAATVLLVFDETNRRAILQRYPGLDVPIVKLGDFAAAGGGDIEDPYDGDAALYEKTYAEIERAVAGLATLLNAALAPRA